jgi:hypothetical protein
MLLVCLIFWSIPHYVAAKSEQHNIEYLYIFADLVLPQDFLSVTRSLRCFRAPSQIL